MFQLGMKSTNTPVPRVHVLLGDGWQPVTKKFKAFDFSCIIVSNNNLIKIHFIATPFINISTSF